MSVALVACSDVKQGVLQPIPPLAGLRYVNLVNDTGAVDFRIINFIGDAPAAGSAAFRTGGAPYGVSTNFLPPHFPVEAGREVHIRVFMADTLQVNATQVMFDTTCTFTAGTNYTFYLIGSARGGAVHSLLTSDVVPSTIAATGLAFRVLHMGGTAMGNVDVDIAAQAATSPLAGTATFANVAPGTLSSYVAVAASATLKAVTTAPGSRGPFVVTANAPAGVLGTTTVNPVAGTAVAGTAITAVIVSSSVTGSAAPQTAAYQNPTVIFMIDKKPALTAP